MPFGGAGFQSISSGGCVISKFAMDGRIGSSQGLDGGPAPSSTVCELYLSRVTSRCYCL